MLRVAGSEDPIDAKSEEIIRLLADNKSYSVVVNLMYLDAFLQRQDFLEYFVTATGFMQEYSKFFFAKTVEKHVVVLGLPSWKAFLEKVFFSFSFFYSFSFTSHSLSGGQG